MHSKATKVSPVRSARHARVQPLRSIHKSTRSRRTLPQSRARSPKSLHANFTKASFSTTSTSLTASSHTTPTHTLSSRTIVTSKMNQSPLSLSTTSSSSFHLPTHANSKRSLWIYTEDTPNPLSLKFLCEEKILARVPDAPSTVSFTANERAAARNRSELAFTILCLEGVNSVMLGETFLTVTITDAQQDWLLIKPGVYAAISDALATENTDTIYNPKSAMVTSNEKPTLPGDEDTVELIKEIIDHRIRPILLNDGGDIEFIEFDKDRTLWLMMKGSCDGCPSSASTLNDGIRKMIFHYVPEVEEVKEYKEPMLTIGEDAFQRLEEKLAKLDTAPTTTTTTDEPAKH